MFFPPTRKTLNKYTLLRLAFQVTTVIWITEARGFQPFALFPSRLTDESTPNARGIFTHTPGAPAQTSLVCVDGRIMAADLPTPPGKTPGTGSNRRTEMSKNLYAVLFVAVMIAVIVGVDLLFFRNHLWERLAANVGIVLVFVAFYWRFFKNS